jgi:tetratricopeptide (TPR) repeat protein
MRSGWLSRVVGVVILLLAGGAYWAVDEWRFRSDLELATREISQGRFGLARSRFDSLASRRPNNGEVLYQLGVCESRVGHDEAARTAWKRVPAQSSFGGKAAVQLARIELRHHRLAAAEVLMSRAVGDSGPHAIEAVETLVNLYKIQGRYVEARRLVRMNADRYPDRIGLLKELAQLGSTNPHKLDLVREGLETASKASAEDDRIWLGWANLATRVGRYDEARAWLERCSKNRSDDAAVWRGWLELALSRDDEEMAGEAIRHLPAGSIESAEVLGLRAWFAERAGDEQKEGLALRELVDLEPANLRALERLAELELRAGRVGESARLRARKAELDRAKAQYESRLFEPDASARAHELARLSEMLDRRLESRVLWNIVLAREPGDRDALEALARLERVAPHAVSKSAMLIDLLSERRGNDSRTRAQTAVSTTAAEPEFVDDAEAAGLRFTFDNGIDPLRHLPETMSGGVGLLDYDGDGWLDVYCVQGGSFLPDSKKPTGGDRLFRNRGDGTFEDATEQAGLSALSRGYGHGVTVGDYDNDGCPDLLVTRWRSYALYHNKGDGTFEETTTRAGLGGDRDWPTSAAFADLDGDGDLDLYVCHYLRWDAENPKPCWDPEKKAYVFCGPPQFESLPDHLFRNDGGRFVDVTVEAGIVDTHGQGLGVVACDFDGDGRIDLYVANDQSASFLFRNLGNMRFEEVGETSGVASSADGKYQASMGIACGDADGDGRPDLAVTTFYNEGTTLYNNLGGGIFADHSVAVGLTRATRYMLGFGAAFLDFNADGRLDLATANGHVDDFRPKVPYLMSAQLLAGVEGGNFVDVSEHAGAPWRVARLGRGLAAGDLDNDGKVDLVILSQNQPLAYFHNRTIGGHWLTLKLEGTGSNRDAVGARVMIRAGGRSQTAWRFGGGSYQSASDPRLHFGLGQADQALEIEVTWPSGRADRYEELAAGTGYVLREGESKPRRLLGFAR